METGETVRFSQLSLQSAVSVVAFPTLHLPGTRRGGTRHRRKSKAQPTRAASTQQRVRLQPQPATRGNCATLFSSRTFKTRQIGRLRSSWAPCLHTYPIQNKDRQDLLLLATVFHNLIAEVPHRWGRLEFFTGA